MTKDERRQLREFRKREKERLLLEELRFRELFPEVGDLRRREEQDKNRDAWEETCRKLAQATDLLS